MPEVDSLKRPAVFPSRPPIVHGGLILLFYSVLTLVVTYPVVAQLSSHLVGHPDIDVWNHAWGFWWVKTRVMDAHEVPLFTRMIGYPKGGRLYFIDPLNALLSMPLQALWGLVPAYNLTVLAELAFAGIATHWLARSLEVSTPGALLAGSLVCTSPVLRCEMHNGITEVGNVGWLALAMLALHRVFRTGRFRDAVLAGGATATAFVACWYHGMAAGGVALVLAVHAAWRHRSQLSTVRRAIPPAIGYLLTALFLAAPFWAAFLWTLQGDGSIIKRLPGLNAFLVGHNATDLLSFFHPGQYYSPDLWVEHGERFLHTTYLGFVPLVAALLGVRHKQARPWILTGVVFAVLALGPYLYVGGRFVTVGKYLVPLPFAILSQGIGLMAITHPARMVIVTVLCLAIVAGMGMDRLVSRFPRFRHAWSIAFLGGTVVEMLLLAPGPFPMSTAHAEGGPGLQAIAQDPEPGAILDVPVQYLNTMRTSRYLYEQTIHGRPTPYIVNVRAQSTPWLHQSYLYQWIRALPGTPHITMLQDLKRAPVEKLRASLNQDFIRAGYRYIVIHRRIVSPPFGVWPYRHLFDPVLGPPEATPDGLWIYRLPGGVPSTDPRVRRPRLEPTDDPAAGTPRAAPQPNRHGGAK